MCSSFEKSIFFKLYRYYIKKLFLNWLIYVAFVAILSLLLREYTWSFRIGSENIWKETWKFCGLKSLKLSYLGFFLINPLVREAVKKEDAAILTIAYPINRFNILLAKIAAVFTYFWITNCLLFSLPILLLSGAADLLSRLTFLLFDSLVFGGVIFSFIYTPLFYFYFPARRAKLKFLVFFFYFILLVGYLLLTLQSIEIFKTPWIPIGLSLPVGLGFLFLYWNDFRQHDYT